MAKLFQKHRKARRQRPAGACVPSRVEGGTSVAAQAIILLEVVVGHLLRRDVFRRCFWPGVHSCTRWHKALLTRLQLSNMFTPSQNQVVVAMIPPTEVSP